MHVGPNLALTLITLGTSIAFNIALVSILFTLDAGHIGLLHLLPLPQLASAAVAVVVLDLSFYVAHRAMHWSPSFWRFHAVHHSDPAVDVTTTIRQHPGETVIRYGFMAAFAIVFGTPPSAFAVYRVWSVLNGLLEHANVRVPERLDRLLSVAVTTPNMHKVHHSRRVVEANTNYGNIFSVFDRICATFTPSVRGTRIAYGLNGLDEAALHSTLGLLALPFRKRGEPRPSAAMAHDPDRRMTVG
jgi:sterol desaturase/sphingolipid hydroxylase (fatty acid hydroxylase superfamily)